MRSLVLITSAALIFGCSTTPARPALMANMAKNDVTVAQLRAMDYEYALRFGELVAMCVLDIVGQTEDRAIRTRAYQWRMWAMPQARAAAFVQDPAAGLLELWVLASQQRHFFTEGAGKDYFGEQQGCVLDTTKQLEQEAEEIARAVMTDEELEELPEAVRTWVREHPIEGQLFVRPTARTDLAALVPQRQQSGLEAVGSMEETFRDLNDRLSILTLELPIEARWQAELLTQALFEERIQEPADAMVATMANVNDFLDEFETTLAGQVSILLDAVKQERLALMDAVAEERILVLEAITAERMSVMTKLDEQLVTATTELDGVGRGLIDHFFLRLAEVLVVVGIVSFLIVALVLLVLRGRGRTDD
jgi:hypothetical protein